MHISGDTFGLREGEHIEFTGLQIQTATLESTAGTASVQHIKNKAQVSFHYSGMLMNTPCVVMKREVTDSRMTE